MKRETTEPRLVTGARVRQIALPGACPRVDGLMIPVPAPSATAVPPTEGQQPRPRPLPTPGELRRTELLQYAIEYHALGWNLLPLRRERIPVVSWKRWQSERFPLRDLERLIRHGDSKGRAITGLAVVCGWISGWPGRKLACRDFDDEPGYRAWAARFPELAAILPTVRTRRGLHVYFHSPIEINQRYKRTDADGELKATPSTYAVLPPSMHFGDGHEPPVIYQWANPLPLHHPEKLPLFHPADIGLIPNHTHNAKAIVSLMPVGGVTQAVFKSALALAGRGSGSEGGEGEAGDESEAQRQGVGEAAEDSSLVFGPEVWGAVARTLPDEPSERNARLFELARHLKAIPHIADAPAADLEPVVRRWFERARPVITTKRWATTWSDFRTAWNRVRLPAGEGAYRTLMEVAAAPFAEPKERLVAVCCALDEAARKAGADRFWLSCRTAASVCCFPGENGYRSAHRWLCRLVDRGVLALVNRGKAGPNSKQASEYRFVGERGATSRG